MSVALPSYPAIQQAAQRLERHVAYQIETAVEVLPMELAENCSGWSLTPVTSVEAATEKIQFFRKLIGGSLGRPFAEQLGGNGATLQLERRWLRLTANR